jgi:hypothetical protein
MCVCRDVHKDFKKKGFGFGELQAGLMVCRPCHSAIHRAVPDNKELGLHCRTLDALRQVRLSLLRCVGFNCLAQSYPCPCQREGWACTTGRLTR